MCPGEEHSELVERPEYYVLEMRRLATGKFRTRMLHAGEELSVEIPEEVLARLIGSFIYWFAQCLFNGSCRSALRAYGYRGFN